MSTIEHTASSEVGKVPILRRISELMHEKGDGFSIRAFSSRIGISRELLRRILAGDRHITPSTLEKIAQGLGISVERLKQTDTEKQSHELNTLWKAKHRTRAMLFRALDIATELVAVSKGVSERAYNLSVLGRVQFELQHYDEAHESFLSAFEHSEKVHELHGDSTLLHLVTSYLMVSYTIRKEYTSILQTLTVVEDIFAADPEKMGYAHYTRMKWYEHRGDLDRARRHSYVALECFEKTEDTEQIGKALINVAHFEYLAGNYQKSELALSDAISNLKNREYFYLIAVKEYAKTLIQLKEHAKASQLLDNHLGKYQGYPDLMAKLQILNTIAKDDPSFAIKVSSDQSVSLNVRYLACKQLMNYFSLKDDSASVMRYYKLGQILTDKKTKFFEEEGF